VGLLQRQLRSVIATGQTDPQAIATDGKNVYWINPISASNVSNGTLNQTTVGGGNSIITLASGLFEPHGVATDGVNVY
jgi:hypothetical protein